MNSVRFGIVARRVCFSSLLTETSAPKKVFFGEEVDSDEMSFHYEKTPGIRFNLYEVTNYLKSLLPDEFMNMDIQYASIYGDGWDDYYDWVIDTHEHEIYHPFELALTDLIENARSCAIFLLPDDEKIEKFVARSVSDLIFSLRTHIRNIACSPGLLGTIF